VLDTVPFSVDKTCQIIRRFTRRWLTGRVLLEPVERPTTPDPPATLQTNPGTARSTDVPHGATPSRSLILPAWTANAPVSGLQLFDFGS